MEVTKLQKHKDRLVRSMARSAQIVLDELEENPHAPARLQHFIQIMRELFVNDRLPGRLQESHKDVKVVGTYCVMIPEEIIYAAGAVPVRLCGGGYETAMAADELAPRDTCPVVKASIGSTLLNAPSLYDRCDAVIVPTTCDAKRKMGDALSRFKDVWMLEVPHVKDREGSKRQWLQQLYALKRNIEKFTGQRMLRGRIRLKNLDASIKMIGEAQYQARRLHEIRKATAPVISGREALLAMHAYCFDAASAWTKAMAALNDELEARCRESRWVCSEQTPRILLAGCPSVFPNWKIPLLIEEMGAVIVADESCMGDRFLYDPVGITEKSMKDMMTGIAARYLMPCVCPSFSPNDDRLYRLTQMCAEFKVDGIIYHVLKGCVSYDFELSRVERSMKERDIPVLRIETDYNPEDVEQLRTRIEAFVEMLGSKNQKYKMIG
jgi:benzoyl-CoA reductase/2-hydroxyglutaryl-CoA dehydratase subunit BcrC/BadD/HgdB